LTLGYSITGLRGASIYRLNNDEKQQLQSVIV